MSVAPNKSRGSGPICRRLEQSSVQPSPTGRNFAERNEVNRSVRNIIVAVERSEKGFVDVPPGSIDDEIEIELATFGYAVALSDHLWIGGHRVHSPESVQAGNYRLHVPPSIFTCVASRLAHVPDVPDFDLEAILEERGELRSN